MSPTLEVNAELEPFQSAVAEGRLVVEHCDACGAESLPPYGICRRCGSRSMSLVEVTGEGVIYSYTINYQRWLPDLDVPYAIVLVEFPQHPGVRVMGRLRDCPPEEIAIDDQVRIGFEPGPGGFAIPSFVPVDHPGR